jgi:integrase
MSIRFIVRGEKRDTVPIYVRHGSISGRVKSGYMIEPARWSNDTETIRQRKLTDSDQRLIQNLDDLKTFLKNEDKLYSGDKSKEWLQSVIDKYHGKNKKANDLNSFIANFLEKAKTGELKTKKGTNYSTGTIKSLKGLQTALLEYQGIYSEDRIKELNKLNRKLRKRKIIDFDDITIHFYNDFVAFLSNEGSTKGYSVNTVDKHLGSLKYFMAKSLSEKLHSNREFMESSFAGFSEESHAIYLTLDEIEKIWKHKIIDKRMELSRDCYITLCETAVRISDYKQISVGVRIIDGKKFFDIHQTKTGGRVVIPLTKRMEAILDRYNGKLPYIHEVYVNKFIKTIAFQCGLTETITWPAMKKGLKYKASAPKYKLITCHTGRRSAATNMVKAGIPIAYIMKLTGHKTEKTFWKYVRITEEEVALELSKHAYFDGHLKVAK